MALGDSGFDTVPSHLPADLLDRLRISAVFREGRAGFRCLLDDPRVREMAIRIRDSLASRGLIAIESVAIQAIAFDKTAATNWKVAWHQDLLFPFAKQVRSAGYSRSSEKDGVAFACPPVKTLESLTAVRLSLDDCGPDNGPLRVSPGTHREGVIPGDRIRDRVAASGEVVCTHRTGDLVLMKPLLLHASSQASAPEHRRVLHFVYHSGPKPAEPWHREV
ncbi:MAG: phytanoyl-CoA dioxygenase family protein [Akkermansiaceae bacterium]|nr:phytanoyl-CoA dioxygenase family protein [Akkermansiaceae bacterium]MCP5547818.1 phytanoyl-CoA dioxygenase family protein [Akkermansiaceae bacterium]